MEIFSFRLRCEIYHIDTKSIMICENPIYYLGMLFYVQKVNKTKTT